MRNRKFIIAVGLVLTLALAAFPVAAQYTLRPPVTNAVDISCDSSVVIAQASATTTELVALDAAKRIYVCGFVVNQVGAATAPTFRFVSGTGASCGTGTTNKTGVFSGDVGVGTATTVAHGNGKGLLFAGALGEAICITSTTTQAQAGVLTYAQF